MNDARQSANNGRGALGLPQLVVEILLLLALIGGGAAVRILLRDLPNFAPVAALSLFAGYTFSSRRLAALAPLGVMVASDLVIGGYSALVMAVVYASLTAPVLAGPWLRRRLPLSGESASRTLASLGGLVGAGLVSSVMFFLTTNFATWAAYDMYAPTLSGLLHCYLQALPFFRATLAGDMLFSLALFGSYAAATALSRRASRQASVNAG